MNARFHLLLRMSSQKLSIHLEPKNVALAAVTRVPLSSTAGATRSRGRCSLCGRGLSAVTAAVDCLVVAFALPRLRVASDADSNEPRALSTRNDLLECTGHNHLGAEVAHTIDTLGA